MTISTREAEQILRQQERYVDAERPRWDAYRSAYTDEFWRHHKWGPKGGRTRTSGEIPRVGPITVETNMVRPYVDSFLAGLFYKGMRVLVRADDVVLAQHKDVLEGYEPGEPQQAIAHLCERFLNVQHVDTLSDHGFSLALLYPECAFKLGINETLGDDPIDQIWFDPLPAWECVWDREARGKNQRYRGHTYWMPREEFEETYGDQFEDADEIKSHVVKKPDVLSQGFHATERSESGPKDAVRLFELHDFTSVYGAEEDELDEDAPVLDSPIGVMRVYMVMGSKSSGKGDDGTSLKLLAEEAIPYDKPDGSALSPILPVVLTPVPEYPWKGIASVASIYEINKERNWITTAVATAFRRDYQRVLLILEQFFDEQNIADLESGKDHIIVKIKDEANLSEIAQYLKNEPLSPTIFKYLDVLIRNQQETQGIADFARGKSLNYATATEVTALNDYTETTLGRIRKKMDRILSSLCAMFLRVLSQAVGETFRVRIGKEVKEFPADLLDVPWEITLSDLANTPLAEAQRRGEFTAAAPQLLELAALASNTNEDPVGAKLAQAMLDHMVEIYDLPDSFSWRFLSQTMAEPEPEPEPEPAEQPITAAEEATLVDAIMSDPNLAAAAGIPVPTNGGGPPLPVL